MQNVTVITAVKLDSKQEDKIVASLDKKIGTKKYTLTKEVNPNIIGGVQIRVGSKLYDGSVISKINRIKQSLSDM